jgi:hypothetical protein
MTTGKEDQNKKQKGFRDQYALEGTWVQRPKASTGRPGIKYGEDESSGNEIVLKQWQKSTEDNDSLRSLWANEVRQLNTLIAYPASRDLIVPMVTSGEDHRGFYLVLDPGLRTSLHEHQNSARPSNWIRHPRRVQNRAIIWANAARIAKGIGVLHRHGILHRNLDEMSIFTDGGETPDFQLTGFEWSIRLHTSPSINKKSYSHQANSKPYTFNDDWKKFGFLFCKIFDLDPNSFIRGQSKNAEAFLPSEKELLRTLIRGKGADVIDESLITSRIADIQTEIAGSTDYSENALKLAVKLGKGSMLSSRIVEAADNAFTAENNVAQLDFIEADIGDAILYEVKSHRSDGKSQLLLQGRNLTYRLSKFSPRQGTPSWDVAYCENANRQPPNLKLVQLRRPLRKISIELKSPITIKRDWATLVGTSRNWSSFLNDGQGEANSKKDERFYLAFVLLQSIKTLFEEAKACPVRVIKSETGILEVAVRTDNERSDLYTSLDLDSPAALLKTYLSDDSGSTEEDWIVEELSGKQIPTFVGNWQFSHLFEDQKGQTIYCFQSATSPPPISDNLLIRPITDMAEAQQAKRQMKALSALREHLELLEVMEEPRKELRTSGDPSLSIDSSNKLDTPKQDALNTIWNTLPAVLVQGPPGVGKTHLVRELLRQRFYYEPYSRILISAQSHHAVDHVMEGYLKDHGANSESLVIRSKSTKSLFNESQWEIRQVAKNTGKNFLSSELFSQLPKELKERCTESFPETNENYAKAEKSELRALENLLLKAANVVFTTTNSYDIERLIDDQSYFDHVIIEEAAKANGLELSAPMMLSHRRLLIGDHKQLPPFDEEKIIRLLSSKEKVSTALSSGTNALSTAFRASGLQDIIDDLQDVSNGTDFGDLCDNARSLFSLFERLVTREFDRKANLTNPIALRLTTQHRMHPEIASLVSQTFYESKIETSDEAKSKFSSDIHFKNTKISSNDDKPITFINLPYSPRQVGYKPAELHPPFSNPQEAKAIVDYLEGIEVTDQDKKLNIAVLSPYRHQVDLLRDEILNARRSGKLKFSERFIDEKNDNNISIHIGTVDSFQGDESDLVIISMVRNNHHSGLSGIGFMRRPNRMNVLASRAIWKLVLVGSLEFWNKRVVTPTSNEDQGAFLERMFNFISNQSSSEGSVSVIDANTIKRIKKS